MAPSKRRMVFFLLGASMFGVNAVSRAAEGASRGVVIDPPRQISSHKLTDQNGQTQEFPAHQWQLVFFGFTHCPDVCPMTMHKAAEVLDKLGDSPVKLDVNFITIDPEHDTPEAMRSFLEHHGRGIRGLTGSLPEMQAVGKNFEIVVRRYQDRDTAAVRFDHSAFLYLLDPQGRMILFYPATVSVNAIVSDFRQKVASTK